jgi:outer membrane protein assembly factor BamB
MLLMSKVTLLLYSLLLGAVGCKPDEPITPDPDPVDTVKITTTFSQQFKVVIPNMASGALLNQKVWIYNGNPIIATQDNQSNALIVCFDGATGQVKWSWAEMYGSCVGGGDFVLADNYVVACLRNRFVVVIDAQTGQTVWTTEVKSNSAFRLNAFDGYVYYSHERSSGSTAYFVRSPLRACSGFFFSKSAAI